MRYKLHCISTVTDFIIPLVFDLTTANVYDNQASDLLYEAKIYNQFLILADVAYDLVEWFEISFDLEFNLLTDINMLKVLSNLRINDMTMHYFFNLQLD
ncbi:MULTISPECIES: transposase [unclassified Clostridium]|uniref:transposase n=1 Tax=unclassified Clostridium TaxID=2614128 RepID=UPI00207A9F16|nr:MULTISPECIES: transposase [unclassified Clostridium]